MAEFRTSMGPDESDEDSGSSTLMQHFEKVIDNIQNDPEIQARLFQQLQESDIDPVFMRAILPDGIDADALQQTEQTPNEPAQEAPAQTQPMPNANNRQKQTEPETVDFTPDDLVDFTREIIEVSPRGAEMTLGELVEFAEQNPGVVQTAIDMKL